MSLGRRTILKGLGVAGGIGLAGTAGAKGSGPSSEQDDAQVGDGGLTRDLTVTQESDKSMH